MHIRTVSIVVPDPEASAAFFEHTLGLPVTRHGGHARVRIGASTLILQPGESHPDGYYHLAFDIPENRITEARDLLRRHGIAILPAGDEGIVTGSPAWDAHSVYFNAPGNLNLEFIARHRLPNAIETPFTFADTVNISEVGIPVADPLDAVGRAQDAFGIAPFGEPSEMFAPIGSDDGLLILVPSGRIWFPTADQATTNRPLQVKLAGIAGSLDGPTCDPDPSPRIADPAQWKQRHTGGHPCPTSPHPDSSTPRLAPFSSPSMMTT